MSAKKPQPSSKSSDQCHQGAWGALLSWRGTSGQERQPGTYDRAELCDGAGGDGVGEPPPSSHRISSALSVQSTEEAVALEVGLHAMEAAVLVLEGSQLGEHVRRVAAAEMVAAEGPVEGEGAFQDEGDGAVLGSWVSVGSASEQTPTGGSGPRRWSHGRRR